MTQVKTTVDKITELNNAFFHLSSANQDYAMAILRSLKFAQENCNRDYDRARINASPMRKAL